MSKLKESQLCDQCEGTGECAACQGHGHRAHDGPFVTDEIITYRRVLTELRRAVHEDSILEFDLHGVGMQTALVEMIERCLKDWRTTFEAREAA